jgi:tRNA-specific 2-thiouridylase
VGPNENLYHKTLEIAECNIVDKEEFITSDDVSVVIRGIGRNPEGFMRRAEAIDGGYRIHLDDAAWAPAVGQPVVFYRQNRVIGGGILSRYY